MTNGWYGNRQKHALYSKVFSSRKLSETYDFLDTERNRRIESKLEKLDPNSMYYDPSFDVKYLDEEFESSGKRIVIDWDKGYLTEREILLLKARMNRGEDVDLSVLHEQEEIEITKEQTQKGYDWLMNQWKTPRGLERKNNPFGYREQYVLEGFKKFYLVDFYNIGNIYHNYYTPVYRTESESGEYFDYILKGGEINIIG